MSKKVLFNNIASMSVVQIANYVLPLISIPIISRIIGPERFGIINYAAAFITYFTIFINYGFDLTATRRLAKDPNNRILRNKIFSEVLQAEMLLFLISTILFIACLYFVPPLRKASEVAIFSYLLCVGTLFTQNWLFLAMQDLSKVALFDFTSKLLFTITILVVVREKKDYLWQPLITSLVQIIVAMASFIWAVKKYKLKFIKISINDVLLLLKKESIVFLSLISITLYTTTNIIILGLYQNPEKVGFYTGGQKLIIVAYSVISLPLSHALFPYIGKAFSENQYKGLFLVQKIMPLIVLSTGSLGIIMLIFGPWALRIFYGSEFEPSVLVFQLLVFTPMFITMGNIFGIQVMLNLKMDKSFLKIIIVAALISVFANFLLVKKFGYVGTALNWLLTEVFIATTMYIFLRMKGINPIDIKQFHPRMVKAQLEPFVNKFMHFRKSLLRA